MDNMQKESDKARRVLEVLRIVRPKEEETDRLAELKEEERAAYDKYIAEGLSEEEAYAKATEVPVNEPVMLGGGW
jgi:hypothetical protein